MRTLRALLAAAALLAAVRLAVWMHSRWAPPAPAKARPQAGVPAELDTRELKILMFYATRIPAPGEPFTICYGVLNAERVELDPPLAELYPSLSRCVEVTVRKDTRFTLRAYGRAGEPVSASFDLRVRAAGER
ncbi:MAG: hypothetical protein KatS3mg005_0365 [Bryobacteraceae bacterium]|nr:MAG: hypothetical protein KatS3mg005_0365 [Bryobacteraceae bacterium]